MSNASESPATAPESPPSPTKKSAYEAWKQVVMDADAEGVEIWTEELSEASGPLYRRQGALDGNGLTPLLISVGLLLASAIVLLPKFKHITRGEWSVGIVVGHQKFGYGTSGSIRAPIIRYSAPGGVFDKVADLPAAEATYPLGKEVWVLFVRGEPGNAVVADFVQLFMIPTVVGFLGLICFSGTTVYLIWHVRPELATKASAATRRQLAAALATGDKQDSNDAEGGPTIDADGGETIDAEGGPTIDAEETSHAANMSQHNDDAAHSAAIEDVAPPRDAAGHLGPEPPIMTANAPTAAPKTAPPTVGPSIANTANSPV
jgi:hypothetical protein